MINMSALQNRIILQSGSSIHPQCPELFAKRLIFERFCLGRPILPGTASDGTIATLCKSRTAGATLIAPARSKQSMGEGLI